MRSLGTRWLFALCLLSSTSAFAQGVPGAARESILAMLEAGQLAGAERELRALLERTDDPVARQLLGVALLRMERPEEAEKELRRAVELAPEFAVARQQLARLYLKQDRTVDAANELRAAAGNAPLDRDLGLWLAAFEQAAGDPDAAERQLRSVAEQHGSVRALLELARLQTRRGDHEASLKTLRRALTIAPNSEAVLRAHAEVSMAAGAPMSAMWALEPLSRMHPTTARYPYLLGVTRLKMGDAAGAMEDLDKALALDASNPLTLIALGLAYNNQRRFDEAAEFFSRSLRLEPENAEALAGLAQSEEGRGHLDQAERHARRALDHDPDHALASLVLGMVSMKRGDHAAARDSFLRSIASDPGSVKAHYQLSLAFARLGDADRSRHHLEVYREALAQMEAALVELNTRTGIGDGGS